MKNIRNLWKAILIIITDISFIPHHPSYFSFLSFNFTYFWSSYLNVVYCRKNNDNTWVVCAQTTVIGKCHENDNLLIRDLWFQTAGCCVYTSVRLLSELRWINKNYFSDASSFSLLYFGVRLFYYAHITLTKIRAALLHLR